MKIPTKFWALSVVLFTTSVALSQNLIVNGDFEDPSVSSSREFHSGENIGGWTVVSASYAVTVLNNSYVGGGAIWPETPSGSQLLYLGDNVGTGVIEQTLALPEGLYELSFLQADFKSLVIEPGGKLTVSLRNPLGQDILSNSLFQVNAQSDFVRQSTILSVPIAGQYTLGFSATPRYAALVDDIRLTAAPVPEPATLAALGLGALGLLRRRRAATGEIK